MSNPRYLVDWSKPIELDDGTPVNVDRGPNDKGNYLVEMNGHPFRRDGVGVRLRWWYGADGVPPGGDPAVYYTIRNASETGKPAEEVMSTKTLRDEFAMAALSGMMASPSVPPCGDDYPENYDRFAHLAGRLADAMMAERAKGGDA